MTVAIIFAGGVGIRFHGSDIPKQFMQHDGKTVLVHTLTHFQNSKWVDRILVVCVEDWIQHCRDDILQFGMDKVTEVIPGGKTGQESIYNGLRRAGELFPPDSTVLIHDGVRPLIEPDTIEKCVKSVHEFGSAITVADCTETVLVEGRDGLQHRFVDRSLCRNAKAPQCFVLKDILVAHGQARKEKMSFIDSAMLMSHYGYQLHLVYGSAANIKITTMEDYQIFCALYDLRKRAADGAE